MAEQASVQSLNAHRFPPLGGYCIAPCGRYISKKGLSWGKVGLLSGRYDVEGPLEVGEEVFDILQPHAEAEETLADVLGIVEHAQLGVIGFLRVELHQALGVAEADRGPARSYFTGRM